MTKSSAPKSEYVVGGKTLKIDPQSPKVEGLRNKIDHDKWVNRETRQQTTYAKYQDRPIVIYHDPYNSFFWWYLLDRSLDDRARWAYNHKSDMDEQRYKDLLAKDEKLEARIKELEKNKEPKDPNYSFSDVDPDLQYSDEYVDAAYNAEEKASEPISGWACFGFICLIIVVAIVVAILVALGVEF